MYHVLTEIPRFAITILPDRLIINCPSLFTPYTALRIHVSQSTINIIKKADCKFEYIKRGETYLKVCPNKQATVQ